MIGILGGMGTRAGLDFCNKFNIPYDKTKLDMYINKNEQKQSVNKEIEALIKEKDYLIYKHFYQ